MAVNPPLLVFTDLDGTLLSHETYAWDAARPALSLLCQIGAGVILASSKTAPEITTLRDAMSLGTWPAIVENGAGILSAETEAAPETRDYEKLRGILGRINPELRKHFTGFGDMTVEDVVSATGLPLADAANAKRRSFSEPGLWSGTVQHRERFVEELIGHDVTPREGGRFLTLSFGQTKADRMKEIIALFKPRHTIALGDAPNDVEMLEAADHGVIVANPHRDPLPPLSGEATGQITRTTKPGPEGWNEAVQNLVRQLELD